MLGTHYFAGKTRQRISVELIIEFFCFVLPEVWIQHYFTTYYLSSRLSDEWLSFTFSDNSDRIHRAKFSDKLENLHKYPENSGFIERNLVTSRGSRVMFSPYMAASVDPLISSLKPRSRRLLLPWLRTTYQSRISSWVMLFSLSVTSSHYCLNDARLYRFSRIHWISRITTFSTVT